MRVIPNMEIRHLCQKVSGTKVNKVIYPKGAHHTLSLPCVCVTYSHHYPTVTSHSKSVTRQKCKLLAEVHRQCQPATVAVQSLESAGGFDLPPVKLYQKDTQVIKQCTVMFLPSQSSRLPLISMAYITQL